jgi:hypothetical protein
VDEREVMRALGKRRIGRKRVRRRGAAAIDYVLVLGVVLPMVVFIMRVGPRLIRLAYEMVSVLVAWPFM